jgi:hypothetical protein
MGEGQDVHGGSSEDELTGPKLVALRPDDRSPEVVLHQALNQVDRLKAVVVVMIGKDGTYYVDSSTCQVSEICMASMALQGEAQDQLADKTM